MPGEILVGTSGYSYTDWKGPFYPSNLSQSSFLEYYSGYFSTVEINYTFYRMPEPDSFIRMQERVPRGFSFSVKAFGEMTHRPDASRIEDLSKRFIEAVEPLKKSDRLGCVVFQFPYSFHYNTENRNYLSSMLDMFEGLPLAVEFRGEDWMKDQVSDDLTKRSIAFVCVDEPPLKGLIKPNEIVTSRIGYVRFHGRNIKNWWSGDSASRYDYLYSEEELEEWIPRIAGIASKTDKVFVYMNNHWQGKAVENAVMLKNLLKKNGFKTR